MEKKDAIKDFEKAERQDLINQTNQEIEVLQQYLPKQLRREEIKVELEKIISEIGATTMKDMGAIMKEAKAKMGASADGKTINEVAKEIMDTYPRIQKVTVLLMKPEAPIKADFEYVAVEETMVRE